MKIDGTPYRTIWLADDGWSVEIIDQTLLPHTFETRALKTVADAAEAIKVMRVRGAPLIGVTAAYGVALGMREDPEALDRICADLLETRPTAVNLRWALDRMGAILRDLPPPEREARAYAEAKVMADEDVNICESIGNNGVELIREAAKKKGGRVQILTHCNAGWLATVDWGTALAPIYKAHDEGIDVHVWVDETRPRNQGASLTSWELKSHGVPHTVIVDNLGGHLMQHGEVDLCIVGTDRTTAHGDVCNKIGTYLKALAAHDNDVPFYVALPGPTIDFTVEDYRDIPIEERDAGEVHELYGKTPEGELTRVRVTPDGVAAKNFGFDVTPARLVTALITERGVCPASKEGLAKLYDR